MTKILYDSLHRIAYSTDAFIYRGMPLGVAFPETTEDVVDSVIRARHGILCMIWLREGTLQDFYGDWGDGIVSTVRKAISGKKKSVVITAPETSCHRQIIE